MPLLGETIGQCLDRIASEFGDSEALISCYQGRRWTYRELHYYVEMIARGLIYNVRPWLSPISMAHPKCRFSAKPSASVWIVLRRNSVTVRHSSRVIRAAVGLIANCTTM